jgi:hypothetical protein
MKELSEEDRKGLFRPNREFFVVLQSEKFLSVGTSKLGFALL